MKAGRATPTGRKSRKSVGDEAKQAALRARTYTTLAGAVLDLSVLSADEREYLARCYDAYRGGLAWERFGALAAGPQHPLLRATRGKVTRAVWGHPLYQAVSDLEDRLGVLQGELEPEPGADAARDPLSDEWIPTSDAAREKGVTLPGLHAAIKRGDVIARTARDGGRRLVVSRNSLATWAPDAARQQAPRGRRAAAA